MGAKCGVSTTCIFPFHMQLESNSWQTFMYNVYMDDVV